MAYQNPIIWGVVAVLAFTIGYLVRQGIASRRASSAEERAKTRLQGAEHEASGIILEAKKKAADVLDAGQKEERERKREFDRLNDRILKREEELLQEAKDIAKSREKIQSKSDELVASQKELEETRDKISGELEKVAGLTREEAKRKILEEITERHNEELAKSLQKLDRDRMEEIEKKTLDIITTSIQRYSRSHVSELTTSVFQLPSEDFKGKIIGREGRNIRALERATGVELIVDETPDGIVISSFDPLRREIARLALEKLVKDGRIQPAKIEEKVEEAKTEMQKRMHEIGEAAAFEVGIYDLPQEIIQLVGRLNFRTSFGQNVLTHSIEMAYISGMLASELGANVEIAKKGALLHDIGKAIDHEVEGSHVEIGRNLLKKFGVQEEVIKAMQSHHEDYPYETLEARIVQAADAISAARPGARKDSLEDYIRRLTELENIATSFGGVEKAYAIQAGREVRVFVTPEAIDDLNAGKLARDIANRVQEELRYPGEIKVVVIREKRIIEYAR